MAGLPAHQRIEFPEGIEPSELLFKREWLTTQLFEKAAAPKVLAERKEVLARSSSTGYNLELKAQILVDNIATKELDSNGVVAVSRYPWIKIHMGTQAPHECEFSYMPVLEKLRDGTCSADWMAAFSKLSNHFRSGDRPPIPREKLRPVVAHRWIVSEPGKAHFQGCFIGIRN